MNQNQFVIGRFAIDCCSADALPYGVLVEDTNAPKYMNDAWIKVRGKLETTVYDGNDIMVLKPNRSNPLQRQSHHTYTLIMIFKLNQLCGNFLC